MVNNAEVNANYVAVSVMLRLIELNRRVIDLIGISHQLYIIRLRSKCLFDRHQVSMVSLFMFCINGTKQMTHSPMGMTSSINEG